MYLVREQGMINHVVLARTFSDTCSNLTEFYEDDLKIINTDEVESVLSPLIIAVSASDG